MPELLLHYIWMRKAFLAFPQYTTDGRAVEVINVGTYNTDAGPDFFAATIRIGGVVWTGNVEMHIRASDWYRHRHQADKRYDSVVLHVVCKADKQVFASDGHPIAQCELRFADTESELHAFLTHRQEMCSTSLRNNPLLLTEHWRQALLIDRLNRKADDIRMLLSLTRNSWDESFYITLAHNFGFHTNGLPFEMLAKQTPLAFMRKHRQSRLQLEAMLLGQAQLISKVRDDEYRGLLEREYDFLRNKFSLVPIDGSMWKYLRMRPQNFPEVRVRQFARIIEKSENLFSRFIMADDLKEIRREFDLDEPNDGVGRLGKSSVELLIINSVVPYKYAYGQFVGNEQMKQAAVEFLNRLPAEKNHIIDDWCDLGLRIDNAADSQALLHLTQNYCITNRCFDCEVGYHIFTQMPSEVPTANVDKQHPDSSD